MTDKEQINNFAKDINVPHKHKPIYLDGVDVSWCKYLDTSIFSGNSYWCHLFHNFCNATNYNYNYIHCFDKCPVYQLSKQLTLKTQECEELKRKLSNQEQLYQNEIEIYNQSCLQLRQENDDLYLERLALNTANSGINALLEVKKGEE